MIDWELWERLLGLDRTIEELSQLFLMSGLLLDLKTLSWSLNALRWLAEVLQVLLWLIYYHLSWLFNIVNRNTCLLWLWEGETIFFFDLSVGMIFIQVKGGADTIFNEVFRLRRTHSRVLNAHINQGSPKDTGWDDLHLICIEAFKFVLRENFDLEDFLKGLFWFLLWKLLHWYLTHGWRRRWELSELCTAWASVQHNQFELFERLLALRLACEA